MSEKVFFIKIAITGRASWRMEEVHWFSTDKTLCSAGKGIAKSIKEATLNTKPHIILSESIVGG